MDASRQCLCEPAEVLIVPCGGGSNCGQATAQAAVHLTREAVGEIYCLAGIAARVAEMLDIARQARRLLVIDGCGLQCARRTVEHAGLHVTDYVDLSSEELEKSREFPPTQQAVLFAVKLAKQRLNQAPKGVKSNG